MYLDERLKRLFRNIFGSAAARFVNLVITMILVPLTINTLSSADYAFLSIAISLSMLSAYADLGIGLAIVNTLAGESNKATPRKSQRAVSVVWFTLSSIAGAALSVMGVLAFVIEHMVPTTDALRYQAMVLGAACVFMGLPSGLVQRVLFARHRMIEANAWATVGRLLSLLFVWIVVESGKADLTLLVFGVIGVPVIVGWISVPFVFSRNGMRELSPKLRHYDRRLLRPYVATGLSFLVMQLVPYAEVGVNTLLAGSLIDMSIVPSVDVYNRLFTYIPALISIALFPLWPEIAHAKASGNIVWIIKIKRWSYFFVGGASLAVSFIFLFCGKYLIEVWTHQSLELSFLALTAMATFAVLTCIGTVQSMVLNGYGLVKQQVPLYIVYLGILCASKVGAALMLGLSGMLWVLNMCYIIRLLVAERLLKTSLMTKSRDVDHEYSE